MKSDLAKTLDEFASDLDCLTKRLPDKSMFILLGSVGYTCNIVRLWAERRQDAGDPDHATPVFGIADAMDEWAKTHAPETAPPKDAYRSGKLIALPDDAVELMAKGLCSADWAWDRWDSFDQPSRDFYLARATAALAALTKGADHAG